MKQNRSFPGLIFFITLAVGAGLAYAVYKSGAVPEAIAIA
ncbi:MAG: hypothetical protein JWO95_2565, partial [Verrucomicrobiales bacterium]|nr:hypothetical protein [Verrucomicrobiales bacterium]